MTTTMPHRGAATEDRPCVACDDVAVVDLDGTSSGMCLAHARQWVDFDLNLTGL